MAAISHTLRPDDLTPEARAALGRCYRFLLSLRETAESGATLDGHTPESAAVDARSDERGDERILAHD